MKTQLLSAIGIVIFTAGYPLPSQAENPSHIQPDLPIAGSDHNSTRAKEIAQEGDELATEEIEWEMHQFRPIFNFRNYLNLDFTDSIPVRGQDVHENDVNLVIPSAEDTPGGFPIPRHVGAPRGRVGGGTR